MGEFRLNTYVHAVEFDDKGARTGRDQTFGPDDNLAAPENEWALAAITNPDVWAEGKAPKPTPAPPAREDDQVRQTRARIAELESERATASGTDAETGKGPGAVPAKFGPGSGADKWRTYAAHHGVEVDETASRDYVIAALQRAGKPTE